MPIPAAAHVRYAIGEAARALSSLLDGTAADPAAAMTETARMLESAMSPEGVVAQAAREPEADPEPSGHQTVLVPSVLDVLPADVDTEICVNSSSRPMSQWTRRDGAPAARGRAR